MALTFYTFHTMVLLGMYTLTGMHSPWGLAILARQALRKLIWVYVAGISVGSRFRS